ncbi:MAG: gliding motility-associated C-terminal domain-containing protein, partial [Saprospiraceae bacterium]|nr:gliding motility-associated C-terminal domain-containing protein [Saprospiraceae bacterium]
TVQQDAGLPDVFAGANDSLDCNVSSVQLAGGSATQGVSLVWSGPGGFSSTQLNPTVTVAGAYVLTATATNNCTSQALATVVLDDQAPDASAFGGTLTCTETSITLDGESDEPGASFAWSAMPASSIIGNTEDLVVSSPGTYLLTVTGTNGCTSTASAIVAANADAPSVSAVGGQIDCAQTEVTLDGNSTTAGANFAWSGPAGFTSSQIDTTTSIPGTYTLTVTSSNGCSALAQVEVTADNQAPTALADGGILSCGAAAIDLEGSSTTAGVSYAWTGPGGFTSAEQNPSVSVPGNYILTVTAANGCTGADLAIVAQDANAPVAVAIGGTIDCQQTSLQLQGSSQTNGVQYSWTGPGGFTSTQQNPTVSQDGNYVLTVTAPNGCVGVANAQVDADDTLPDASAVGGMLSCSSTGVGLTGSSITAGAIFAWSGPGGFSSNEQNPTVATAGTYTLTVTAPNGCTSTADATVTNDSNLPNVTASAPELDCNTTSILLDGGSTTPNVSYAWAGPGGFVASIADPTVTVPGNYVLTVTAPNGCASSFNLVVSQDIAQPSATASGGQITCADPTLVITGSSTTAGVTWAWTGPNNFTSSQQNPSISQAGTYILTVTAANGCTSSSSATVTADAGIPALTTTGGTLNCLVNEVQLTANSSISSVEYEWTGPSGFSSTEQSPIVSQSGTYTLMVTTSAGCTTSAQAIVAADTGTPDVNIGPTQELDCVTTSIVLDGSSSNSGQGFDFEWTTVGGNFESGQNTLTPTVNTQGTYSLTITGPNGCSSTASVLVQISDEAPNGALLTVLPPDCFGDENGSIAVSAVTGGIPPYLYSIDNQSFTTSSVFTNLAPGEYEITVEDATGCTWQTSVTIVETPELLVNLETDLQTDLLLLGDSMELEAQITIPASDLSAVVWSPVGIDANCLSCLHLTVAPQIATTYSITVSDQNGCTASDEVLVLVNPGKSIYVPSAFSPNDDGINDILAVFGSRSVSRIKSFVIFSRWGETMYEYYNFVPNDPAKGWDGTHRGERLNPAVFTWFAEVEYIDGKSDVFKGDVSLFR